MADKKGKKPHPCVSIFWRISELDDPLVNFPTSIKEVERIPGLDVVSSPDDHCHSWEKRVIRQSLFPFRAPLA